MSEQEVIDLMKSSKSNAEWNANCNIVLKEYNGVYPSFWYKAIIASGLESKTTLKWNLKQVSKSKE